MLKTELFFKNTTTTTDHQSKCPTHQINPLLAGIIPWLIPLSAYNAHLANSALCMWQKRFLLRFSNQIDRQGIKIPKWPTEKDPAGFLAADVDAVVIVVFFVTFANGRCCCYCCYRINSHHFIAVTAQVLVPTPTPAATLDYLRTQLWLQY